MLVIKGNKTINMPSEEVLKLFEGFEKVVVDLGTGDGNFVYKNALKNPKYFYIGIDPSEKQMKISARSIQRKKLGNVLLIVGSIEKLPEGLAKIANEIYVNFPWGSLLESFAKPIEGNLISLKSLLRTNGVINITIGYNESLEPSETKRMNLPTIDLEYIKKVLVPKYEELGFEIVELASLDTTDKIVKTTWNKRLSQSNRDWFHIIIQNK